MLLCRRLRRSAVMDALLVATLNATLAACEVAASFARLVSQAHGAFPRRPRFVGSRGICLRNQHDVVVCRIFWQDAANLRDHSCLQGEEFQDFVGGHGEVSSGEQRELFERERCGSTHASGPCFFP